VLRQAIRFAILCLIAAVAWAQEKDPAYDTLAKAFDSLRLKDYDAAISLFQKAAVLSPARADIHKNLAYTLLKTGDSEAAREQFGEAMRLEPADLHLALEYAFLCYEARDDAPARKAEARRIFARIKESADPASRATAAQAFENIDAPLAAGIARWQQVLATSTPNFSAYYELAQLAEQRDELELAAANYKAAFQLLPERKSVLIELARVEKARGNREGHQEGMIAALLAASRGGETRAAELAREQLPDRYPYVYEFRKALELDPKNAALHRELAYLLLKMSESDPALHTEAITEFKIIAAAAPDDYVAIAQLGLLLQADGQTDAATPILHNVVDHANASTANRARIALKMPLVLEDRQAEAPPPLDPRVLGERSYEAGFLKDAKRYFLIAHEQNPIDTSVDLKLGWTSNMLHDDLSALHWFDLARQSSDPAISADAHRAWNNLHPGLERFRTTLWVYPLFSSRWKDVFGYGQLKTEIRIKKLPFRPYATVRFVGDERRTTGGVSPENLSESAFIVGAGVSTISWHGAMGWFEVGSSIGYLTGIPSKDIRGGVSYSRTYGTSIAAEHSGWFLETLADSVFISRFDDDLINYSQNRIGYSSSFLKGLGGGIKVQPFWSSNLTFDVKRQYWANFVETGPGFRFHPPGTPPSLAITIGVVHGIYLINEGNPHGPNFNDFRAGVWYAFTK
jgi:Flp pilus assembly protein TadD